VLTTVRDLNGSATVGSARVRHASLTGRRNLVRRRRLVLGLRDWLAVTVIACFSLTLFAVTFFSLIGR